MQVRKITLYVQSMKTVAGTQEFESIQPSGPFPWSYKSSQTKYAHVLPEEQEGIIEEVRDKCSEYGFELEIVDISRDNLLQMSARERKEIDIFPALLSDSGRWIKGIKSREEARAFLRKEEAAEYNGARETRERVDIILLFSNVSKWLRGAIPSKRKVSRSVIVVLIVAWTGALIVSFLGTLLLQYYELIGPAGRYIVWLHATLAGDATQWFLIQFGIFGLLFSGIACYVAAYFTPHAEEE